MAPWCLSILHDAHYVIIMSCHVRPHAERRPTSKSSQSRTYDSNALLLRCRPHPPKALCGPTNFTLNTSCVSWSLSYVVLSTLLEMSAPWRSLFVWSDSDYHGYVTDIDSATDLIQEFAYHTHTSYVTRYCTTNFGNLNTEGRLQ